MRHFWWFTFLWCSIFSQDFWLDNGLNWKFSEISKGILSCILIVFFSTYWHFLWSSFGIIRSYNWCKTRLKTPICNGYCCKEGKEGSLVIVLQAVGRSFSREWILCLNQSVRNDWWLFWLGGQRWINWLSMASEAALPWWKKKERDGMTSDWYN